MMALWLQLLRLYNYNGGARDRQFTVTCCDAANVNNECSITDYLNDFDGLLNYVAPYGQVISGIYSHHDNSRE